MSDFDLSGRSAVVTGAARGLGRAIAEALVRAGAQVWLTGRQAQALEQAAADIQATAQAQGWRGPAPRTRVLDLAEPAQIAPALADIAAATGLDIVVNNVGQRDRRGLHDFALDDVRRLLEVNLVSAFELSRAAARHMAPGRGSIVNITSIAGPLARSGDAVYTMGKGALEALTRALAAELGPAGLRVNAVAPGYFGTETNAAMLDDPGVAAWLGRRTSLGRWGRPAEIAGAVVFLAGPAASYVTGQVLAVDGGYSAHF